MDDAVAWDVDAEVLSNRVRQLASELATWGLELNLGKCQYYCSPYASGGRELEVMGTRPFGCYGTLYGSAQNSM